MDKLRVGVIGTGVIGRLHARNLKTHIPRAELGAICDIDPVASTECAEECGVALVYQEYQELLANGDIRAVVICTPGETHGAIVQAAAEAGKHIFCEKPIDIELRCADQAIEAAERNSVKLQIGFNRRFDVNFVHVRQALGSGTIGQLQRVHIVSRDPVREGALTDLFLDTTIHDLDMVRFLTDSEAVSVYVAGDPIDIAVTVVRLANGAIATIDNSRRSVFGYDQRLEVFGSGGAIAVDNETPHRVSSFTSAGVLRAPPVGFFLERYADSYIAELTAFVRCVLDDEPPAVAGSDGRAALMLALAAQRSCQLGQAVTLPY